MSVGVFNLLVGMFTIYVAITFLQWSNFWSNILGYAVGLTVSYILNSRFTFKYQGHWKRALPKFALVFVVAYLANIVVVMGLIHYTAISDYYAHWLGIPPYTILFYLGSRFFAFKETEKKSFTTKRGLQ